MTIDWRTAIDATATIFAVFLTVWTQRRFERRPMVVTYFGGASSVGIALPNSPPNSPLTFVNTHTVVVRNAGQRSARNIRLRHVILPAFAIWPPLQHHVEDLPGGGREIVIPTLVAGEEITISYLYFPPVVANQVNVGIVSDEGFAQQMQVLLRRPYPRWLQRSVTILVVVGFVAVLYLVAYGVTLLFRYWPI
jgi:hypothetical protein